MDVAGAVGWAVAGPGWDAALALVAQEAQATGTTPERALSTGKQRSQEAGRVSPPGSQGQHRPSRGLRGGHSTLCQERVNYLLSVSYLRQVLLTAFQSE